MMSHDKQSNGGMRRVLREQERHSGLWKGLLEEIMPEKNFEGFTPWRKFSGRNRRGSFSSTTPTSKSRLFLQQKSLNGKIKAMFHHNMIFSKYFPTTCSFLPVGFMGEEKISLFLLRLYCVCGGEGSYLCLPFVSRLYIIENFSTIPFFLLDIIAL